MFFCYFVLWITWLFRHGTRKIPTVELYFLAYPHGMLGNPGVKSPF